MFKHFLGIDVSSRTFDVALLDLDERYTMQ